MLLRNIPKRPRGSDAFHVWAQWVHDRLLKLTFGDSPTVKVNERAHGFTFDAVVRGGGGASGGTGMAVSVVQEFADYLKCNPVKDGEPTSDTINVAKPFWLTQKYGITPYPGPTVGLQLPDGRHYYALVAGTVNQRTDTVGLIVAKEIIWPPYQVGEILQAQQPADGIGYNIADPADKTGGNIITVDLNQAGRTWQVQVGVTCTADYQIVEASFPYAASI